MGHFLDALPFDLSDPAARELWALLYDTYYRDVQVEALLRQAGIRPATINFSSSVDLVWADVLVKSRNQGRLRSLLDVVARGDDEAVATRVRELVGDGPPVGATPPAGPLQWKGEPVGDGAERQIGARSTLLDVAFLRRGTELAGAVCRLKVTTATGEHTHGTAFRIGERRVLTNHHVLFDGDARPTAVEAWFGYERSFHGADLQHRGVPGDVGTVRGGRDHDWAVVDLLEPPSGIPVIDLDGAPPPQPGDRVYIVQHPFGGPKQIGMIHNQVRHVDWDVVQYWTDTEAGSSGSPVFDERWRVVALHHRHVAVRTGGRVEHRNQGRRIERVVEAMAAGGAGR